MTTRSKKSLFFSLSQNVNGRELSTALTVDQLARLAGVSQKTARRWIDGTQRASPQTLELLRIKCFGLLPDPAFNDFFIDDGCIRTPSGDLLTPRDLDACVWLRGLYYRGIEDNRRRKEELDSLLELLPVTDILRRKAQR